MDAPPLFAEPPCWHARYTGLREAARCWLLGVAGSREARILISPPVANVAVPPQHEVILPRPDQVARRLIRRRLKALREGRSLVELLMWCIDFKA